ncbi:MAG: IS5 family transposase [Candidatus Competibacteraceae bacterium]|nr:IS5 family transposase [Candidatus Competibacteraceae bacterium]
MRGIFWILDNGAKWKDLPAEFGSKSTVHRWFQTWVRAGVFESIMRDAGRMVEERGEYRLYECFVDGTFSKARGGGDGIGCTKAGKGVKIMVLVDANGLPVAVDTMSASPHESKLVQGLFDFVLTDELPERIIGDKAYDSDALDAALAEQGMEMIAPHRCNRKKENKTQDGRPPTAIQTPMDGRAHHRLAPELPQALYPMGKINEALPIHTTLLLFCVTHKTGFRIASRVPSKCLHHITDRALQAHVHRHDGWHVKQPNRRVGRQRNVHQSLGQFRPGINPTVVW